ncbi:putative peptidoglycan lipid II flippase [Kineococcus xinjiangensis]|uniref:Putative peptidoglycan lipid II flippase n=1 Tax=Kineococcus xinjiangensis TaxID=512762 RepID=A0A2S6IDH8_9ACTN|nr:murein biosynthesis integral membrane protein MurJ [Kineococcus xinjiangensis]PPK92220.1 putative peptidoglycan lipid II flippase [Kineococcus xinjiangensis]
MALATAASRATGFVRLLLFAAVLGLGSVRQAFDVANVLPNVVYELLLGGVLSATLVPLLVQARSQSPGAALALAQRLLTLVLVVLVGVTVVAVLAAPWLVRLYTRSHDAAEVALTVQWARYFLPQILFYGLAATVGAVLNASARFGAVMWAPVLNNVVVIATLGIFLLVPGPESPGPATLSGAQFLTLAIGTTLGVVAMAAALLPALRATGFRWRLRFDLRGIGLRALARMAAWTLLYVAATQVGVWVQTQLATAAGQLPTYTSAFTLWQLPHAIIAVSLMTALLPRMSASASHGRLGEVKADLDRGMRLCLIALLPITVVCAVCGPQIATVLFAHGATTTAQAEYVGAVLAVLAVGLVPFSVYQLQARAFYAQRDTRTPALVQCAVVTVLVTVQLVLAVLLPVEARSYALATGAIAATVRAAPSRRRPGTSRCWCGCSPPLLPLRPSQSHSPLSSRPTGPVSGAAPSSRPLRPEPPPWPATPCSSGCCESPKPAPPYGHGPPPRDGDGPLHHASNTALFDMDERRRPPHDRAPSAA